MSRYSFLGGLLALSASVCVSAELPVGEKIQFYAPVYQSDKHIELTATLYRPEGDGPHPAIVDLHGCNGIWMNRSKPWIRHHLDGEVAVLLVDSFTPRAFGNICGSLFAVPTWHRARDAHAAKQWLWRQPWIDRERIFLSGYSHGATTVLLALDDELNAAQPFAGAVAVGPWCLDTLRNSYTDLLILIGEEDQWTPAQRCKVMTKMRPQRVELIVYEGAHHGFDEPGADLLVEGYRIRYDAHSAQDAMRRVREFIQQR